MSLVNLDDLKNPDLFVEVPNVPLLDEHTRQDKGDAQPLTVDRKFLEDVARNNNAKFDRTGDPAILIVGHTKDGENAEEKPAVGFALNFRVAPFVNKDGDRVWCLYSDLYYRKDRESVINDYPRRSVELWVDRREIDPIALLGGTTPERDLGVVRYSRDSRGVCYRYSLESEMPSEMKKCEKPKDDKKKYDDESAETKETGDDSTNDPVVAKVLESKPFKEMAAEQASIKSMVQEMSDMFKQLMESVDQDGDGDHDMDDHDAEAEQYQDDDLLAPHDGDDEDDTETMIDDDDEIENSRVAGGDSPVKFNSTMPSATNISTPGAHKMSRESDEVIKLQRKVAELSEFNADLVADREVASLKAKNVVVKNERATRAKVKELYQHGGPKAVAGYISEAEENWQRVEPKTTPADTTDVLKYQRQAGGEVTATHADMTPSDFASRVLKYKRSNPSLSTEEAIEKVKAELKN